MVTSLPKFLFLLILIISPFISPVYFNPLHNADPTTTNNCNSLPENQLLHAFSKAKQDNPNHDPVFLQFADTQELEQAVETLESMGIQILHRYRLLPLVLIGGLTPEKLETIARRCSITNIYPNKIHKLISVPEELISPLSDPNLNSSRLSDIIRAKKLLQKGHNGTGIIIAILDTGIDTTHPDFVDKIIHEVSFVDTSYGYPNNEDAVDKNGHGTGVAGIAAGTGKASNGLYVGIAPGAKLWNVKVLNSFGSGREAGIIAGIEYATFGPDNKRDPSDPDIINLSLGGPGEPEDLSSLAVNAAVAQGVVITASAGNRGPFFSTIGSPGGALKAITVGATTLDGELTHFSSRGFNMGRYPDPDIVAPGQNIIVPLSSNSLLAQAKSIFFPPKYIEGIGANYITLSGTSLASSIIAGACALLLSAFPRFKEFGPIALRIVLMRTARRPYPASQANPNLWGAGALDVAFAELFLTNLGDAPERDLVFIFPHLLLSEPALIAFPGNTFEQKLLLLSAFPGTFTFSALGSIVPFVKMDKSSLYLEKGDVVPITLNLSLPIDIDLTIFPQIRGALYVRKNRELIARIPFQPINMSYPKLRVYFDNFHNREPEDSPLSNFFMFTKLLKNSAIDVVIQNSFISYEALSAFDILLLPDMELMLAQEEIEAIYQFIKDGGNLIVLGAEKESIVVESINELLKPFGITFTETIELTTDQGLRIRHDGDLNVTTFSPDPLIIAYPLFKALVKLTWRAGIGVKVDAERSNIRARGSLTFNEVEHDVLAVHEATPPYRESVFVLGTDYLFYDDLLNKKGSSNRQLAENLFNWLTPDSTFLPQMLVNGTRAAPGDSINLMIYVLDSETSKLIDVVDLTITVELPNGTAITLVKEDEKTPYEHSPGIFRYSYRFPMELHGYYTFKAHSSLFEERLSKTVYVRGTEPQVVSTQVTIQTGGLGIIEPDWTVLFNEPKLDRFDDIISFKTTIRDADRVTLYLTLLGDELNDLTRQTEACYAFPMKEGLDRQYWSFDWHPNISTPAGMYAYFVFPMAANGTFPQVPMNSTGTFILLDSEPVIDEKNTIINEQSVQEFEEHQDDQQHLFILSEPTVTIEISGQDLENTPNELEAWVIVVEQSLFVVEDYIIMSSFIPYNMQTRTFLRNFSLPSYLFFGYLPADTVLIFFLLLRDADGNYGELIVPIIIQHERLTFKEYIESLISLGLIMMGSLFFLNLLLGIVSFIIATAILMYWILESR